jgi:hypothetical protein
MANYEDGFERPEWWDRHLKSQTCSSPSTDSPAPACEHGEKPPCESDQWRSDSEAREVWGIHTDFEYEVMTSGGKLQSPTVTYY